MLVLFARAILLYFFAVVTMRIMGKRQVGQLQPFEMAVMVMIAELAASPMEDTGTPILYGIVPMAALTLCHSLLSAAAMRSERLRAWLCGQPTVLMRDGAICEKQMRRMSVTLNDLMEVARIGGMQDLSQVQTAVMETSGVVSVFPKAAERPLTPRDMGMNPPEEMLPLPLVLDGVVQHENLTRAKRDGAWLARVMKQMGYDTAQDVLFLCIGCTGQLMCQGKGKTTMQVTQPEEGKR